MKHLSDILISEENNRFSLFENMLFFKYDSSKDDLDVLCFASRSITDAFVPATIKYICPFAFSDSEIQSIDFDENSEIEVINKKTFSYSKIIEIRFLKSVKIIGEGAFLNCHFLTKIEFPENSELQIIETRAFANSAIRSFNIPLKFVEFRGS